MNKEVTQAFAILFESIINLLQLLWQEYNVPARKLALAVLVHTVALCMMVYETTRDKQWSSLLRSSLNLQRLRTAWLT